jgi:ABC-type phosphate transport system ATPase subunit
MTPNKTADAADINSSAEMFKLRNIDFRTQGSNDLVAVIGCVGCGKSSFLSAILREMCTSSGSLGVQGRIAYCSQIPWIQNMSLRDNILFGSDFANPTIAGMYERVVAGTALLPDLAILPHGDQTESKINCDHVIIATYLVNLLLKYDVCVVIFCLLV